MPVVLLIFALLLGAISPARAQPAAAWNDPRLVDDFITIALGREFPDEQTNAGRLVRWTRPIRVSATGARPEEWADAFAAHVRRLSRITGHPIELRRGGEVDVLAVFVPTLTAAAIAPYAATYRRLFSDEARFRTHMDRIESGALNAICLANMRVTREFAVVAAVAFIPLDQGPRVVRQCIVEELSQALGLPNDDDAVAPSIFNDRSRYVELTAKDILMLRLLYHPALRPGMNAAEVRAAAPRALADLRRRPFRD